MALLDSLRRNRRLCFVSFPWFSDRDSAVDDGVKIGIFIADSSIVSVLNPSDELDAEAALRTMSAD